MFIEESLWIKAVFSNLVLPIGSTVLDVGSSTAQFRQTQPHIDNNVFYPSRQRGWQIYHLDSKQEDGVDIVCDIDDPSIVPVECIGMRFDLVICANVLEHVSNVEHVAQGVVSLVNDTGYLIVTVPRSYRKHPDPVDTMFRPSPNELERLFNSVEPGMVTIVNGVVRIEQRSYYPVHESHWPFWGYRDMLCYWFPWTRWKVSCVLFQKQRNERSTTGGMLSQ